MRAKFVFESYNLSTKIKAEYFNLPYQIPEDRFKDGLLKNNPSRITNFKRKLKLDYSNIKYKNTKDYFDHVDLKKVEQQIKSDINEVVAFINNNPLTGKLAKAKFEQATSLKEYFHDFYSENVDDYEVLYSGYGTLMSNIPNLILKIDYDIYKGCTIFTFVGDALFYYYTIFTLETNNVIGSGEEGTYITKNELIDNIFYETIWRQFFFDNESDVDDILKGIKCKNKIKNALSDFYNFEYFITENYFDPYFIKLLRSYIKNNGVLELKGSVRYIANQFQFQKKHDPNDPDFKKWAEQEQPEDSYYGKHPSYVFDDEFGWVDVVELYKINEKRGIIWDPETHKWIPKSDKDRLGWNMWKRKWVPESEQYDS